MNPIPDVESSLEFGFVLPFVFVPVEGTVPKMRKSSISSGKRMELLATEARVTPPPNTIAVVASDAVASDATALVTTEVNVEAELVIEGFEAPSERVVTSTSVVYKTLEG